MTSKEKVRITATFNRHLTGATGTIHERLENGRVIVKLDGKHSNPLFYPADGLVWLHTNEFKAV